MISEALKHKIRILFLIDSIETDRAGTEGQLLKLISHLNIDRFECHLGCFDNTKWLKNADTGVNVFLIGTRNFHNPKMYFGLLKYINYLRTNNIDIVHAFFPTSITVGVLFSKLAGVKNIISARRDMGFWQSRGLKFLLIFFYKFFVRFLFYILRENKRKTQTLNLSF